MFSFGVILFEVLNRKLMLVDEIKNDPRKDAQVIIAGVKFPVRFLGLADL